MKIFLSCLITWFLVFITLAITEKFLILLGWVFLGIAAMGLWENFDLPICPDCNKKKGCHCGDRGMLF